MTNKERLREYIDTDPMYQEMKSGLLSELSDFDEFSINHCKDIEDLLKENEKLKADCEDLFNQKEMMFKNMQLNQLKVCELAKDVDLWNKKYNEEFDKNKELHNKIDTLEDELEWYKQECDDLEMSGDVDE